VGWEEEGPKESFDVRRTAGDLLGAAALVGPDGGQFEAVQRALTGQRLAPIPRPLPGLARGIILADDSG
jgi:hypothetical protein